MSAAPNSVLFRPDTLLGICESVGEDLGFNPTWLRAFFAFGIFFNLGATVTAYLALGVIVAVSRWIFPAPAQIAGEQRAEELAAPGADPEPATAEPFNASMYQEAA